MKINTIEKMRSIIGLALGVATAYLFGKHSSWLAGLLALVVCTVSALFPAYIIGYFRRRNAELFRPISEQLASIPTPLVFRWICQRDDAERFADAKVIAKERKQHRRVMKMLPGNQFLLAIIILMLQIFVWYYAAVGMIRILHVTALPVLAGLVVVAIAEIICWVRHVVRPSRENLKLQMATAEEIIRMPADELNVLLTLRQ